MATQSVPQSSGRSGASLGTIDSFASGLGWFSIGLGLAELVASRRLGHLIGVRDDRGMLR